jgi:hypothetical protein
MLYNASLLGFQSYWNQVRFLASYGATFAILAKPKSAMRAAIESFRSLPNAK